MASNRVILAAVLAKWVQPAIESLLGSKLGNIPFFGNIESKIKSSGWVSPQWSLTQELSPLVGAVTPQLIEPVVLQYLGNVPDEPLPHLAHAIVDKAIENKEFSLFEGNVVFEEEDLKELKKLLQYNLPVTNIERYEVKEPIKENEQ
jgi:hypothetical protein